MYLTTGWLLASLSITLLLVRGAIGYAQRRGMLDQPGQRRSHRLPTPRGGGIGIVVAMLVCLPGVLWHAPAAWPASVIAGLLAALVLVALAGWWDDHRSLPILPRLGAQLLAAGLFSLGLLATGLSGWWIPLLLVGGVWSINLHNFMDGIDGLLAQQAVFVGAGLAWLAGAAEQPALAAAAAVFAASALGFWCFNRPPARIFMGDVGSGSAGLLVFAFSAMLWRVAPEALWPALILSSAFVADASLTLLTRMWRGRRWYTAHREHLYQWLVRRGGTHARTDMAYMGWNLLVAAPSAWLAWSHLRMALPITIAVYLGAAVTWLALKRRCLRRHLPKASHVAA
ncbi:MULTISPECIES: MraY family glycosyltransferase [Rhodanobacter]|uniref:MraY family glycosyltransferase n=1 Tax=Rhodanobacter TaxID=75309 RepID=UPI0002610694|nr:MULTISPECIES: glycosyltransferase family 4 protein [Rhodanobacter]EIM04191.1 UDP-N-acetylmuramyl pentapeptide phosphotransferase/UDP-N-acetylglucosamine-1-phosphate transferase [Rhodanobacter denitrificans]KZC20966.1 glycosyl transferase family 4 [Rhodanobacter denitrificans]UJM88912.1 glycosyltransferase family 4 protein [Rhodanobacter denitrificans]UJM95461.1 glycosyltransferase family 4 protein [Rhodanobacter denitrificans]UJM98992.1 glycosyltransferase family 4 protein [Rhodanobacter de